jgi:hypothetical protein
MASHLHLVPWPRKMDIYLLSPIPLHEILRNELSTRTVLAFNSLSTTHTQSRANTHTHEREASVAKTIRCIKIV